MKPVALSDAAMLAVVSADRRRAIHPPALAVGEQVEAVVLGVKEKGFLLLSIGNARLLAETRHPLGEGARFTARVIQNAPKLVLQILTEDPSGGQGTLVDSLRVFRSRPGILEDMFRQLAEFVDAPADARAGALHPRVAAERNRLRGLLASLIFSGGKTKGPDGLPERAAGIDLPGEWDGDSARGAEPGAGKPARGSLQEALLRLSGAIETELAAQEPGSPERTSLGRLASTVRSALESLEVLRDVNILSRQAGGPSVIQIPAAFPGGIRVQEMFICADGGQDGAESGEAPFRVVLCLNMETLGDILVDARLTGGRVTGALRCGTEETRRNLQSGMEELEERMAAAGLPDARFVCLVDRDIARSIQEARLSLPLFQRDAVNFYA